MSAEFKIERWLDTAVSGIRFAPDRRAVEAELREHIEDKTIDLQRIFPDIPPEEARERALSGMGDAEEIQKELARVHKPWLGWLWRASCWLLGGLCFLYLMVSAEDFSTSENSLRSYGDRAPYHAIRNGEKAQLGEYTFQITGAAYLDVPEDGIQEDNIQLALRASSPRFWEPVSWDGLQHWLTAVGPDGVRWPMDRSTVRMDRERDIYQVYAGMELERWGPFYREFVIYIPAEGWQPGDAAVLEISSEQGDIRLSAAVTERVVIS